MRDAHLGGEHMLLALVSAERGGAATCWRGSKSAGRLVLRTLLDVLFRR
ncbi:MAG TPA: hypothetical protein VGV57_08100 [Thermoleophilaceae bacterium]|nr:hypothetical protein [Thermoleophilaceae bacterium]